MPPPLRTVDEGEPRVTALRATLQTALEGSLTALDAYLEALRPHEALLQRDEVAYVTPNPHPNPNPDPNLTPTLTLTLTTTVTPTLSLTLPLTPTPPPHQVAYVKQFAEEGRVTYPEGGGEGVPVEGAEPLTLQEIQKKIAEQKADQAKLQRTVASEVIIGMYQVTLATSTPNPNPYPSP